MDKFIKKWTNSSTSKQPESSRNVDLEQMSSSTQLSTSGSDMSVAAHLSTSDSETSDSETRAFSEADNVPEEVNNFKKKKSVRRHQQFRKQWLEEFDWLIDLKGKSSCKYCQITISNNRCHLLRHGLSLRHQKAFSALKQQPKINKEADKFKSLERKLKIAELKIIMFIVAYNLPFSLATPLVDLIKSVAVDSTIAKKVNIGRTKASDTVKTVFLEHSNSDISEILSKQNFSIIIDETTDVSTTKCLTIVVRYFETIKFKIRDRFLALIELENFDAVSIYENIIKVFAQLQVPLKNCIGFASDNAAVMFGKNNSVKTLLLKDNPFMFTIGCVCHSLHLCSAAASKALPSNVEYLVRNIYVYFSHSAKRQIEFRKLQELFSIEEHKILKSAGTRWLSLEKCVERTLEQWLILQHFFLGRKFDSKSTNGDLACKIQDEINDSNKFYLLFLKYTLKLLNDF